jgi:DNA-binding SARP family transcriptional activator
MGVQLVTLGGLSVRDGRDDPERLLSQRSRAALFIYLTVERRVSRDALTAMFWPESDAGNARHALRQSLYHLTKLMGNRDWISSHSHELVVHSELTADAISFSNAAECGDAERCVRLYHGPFLDGVHLVSLQAWESWVDGRRARYARLFRKACRDLLDARLAAGELVGAIAAAERWVAADPSDDEAQHRLISALAAVGERAEAIRQYETYVRLLAAEGLEPLDETRALVEQLRRERRLTPQRLAALASGAAPGPLWPSPPPGCRLPTGRRPIRSSGVVE